MKQKRLVAIFVFVAMILSLTTPAFAHESDFIDLYTIADEVVVSSQDIQSSGVTLHTFENLDIFISTVKQQFPSISEYEIAYFLCEYTGQSPDEIPESELLEILQYDNISTTKTFIKITENGIIEEVTEESLISLMDESWTSPDNYIRIETGFSKVSTSSGYTKKFHVWSIATWLKYPGMRIEDAFALGTSGTFDDSYNEFGFVYQTFKCNRCGRQVKHNRDVNLSTTVDDDLSLRYTNSAYPYLLFTPVAPRCPTCSGGLSDTYFRAYIKYGVIVEGSANLQAAYGHKTVGFGPISVSVDKDGSPSFSSTLLDVTIVPYNARPVTLQ